jgi:hypothetical protein
MFVLPMLGLSSRFFNAGYQVPKYHLPLNDGSIVFDKVLMSFAQYFQTDHFRIICRRDFGDLEFIEERLKLLGVRDYKVIEYEWNTLGQAHSVFLSLADGDHEEELFVFNIDTILCDFQKAEFTANTDGYLEVFAGEGDHWSFVEPISNQSSTVVRVTEKERISSLCSNGLYFFRSCALFQSLVSSEIARHDESTELYVAPLYNLLISAGGIVKYKEVPLESMQFCGTPEEYELLTFAEFGN